MGIDHGRAEVLVAEQFLNGTDIVAGFEEVGGEAVAEGMTAGGFRDAGGADCGGDGALQGVLVDVVSADLA
jgi:hypothetical protein